MRTLLFYIVFFYAVSALGQTDCPFLPVTKGGKWGFINCRAEIKVDFLYDNVSDFEHSMAKISVNGKVGLIDTSGIVIIPARYESIQIIDDQYFSVKNGNFALTNREGEILTGFDYVAISRLDEFSFLLQTVDGFYKLYHTRLHKLSENSWDKVELFDSSRYFKIYQNTEIGVLDSNHTQIILPVEAQDFHIQGNYFIREYDKRFSFYNSAGKLLSGDKEWKTYRFIDSNFVIVYNQIKNLSLLALKSGQYLFPDTYQDFRILSPDLIVTVKKGKEGLANSSGKLLSDNIYEAVAVYENNYVIVKTASGVGLLATNGKIIIKTECEFIDPFNPLGIAVFSINGKLGLFQKTGKVISQPTYDDIDTDGQTMKCYSGTNLDVFNFNSKGQIEEKLTYQNVHRLSLARRYKSSEKKYFSVVPIGESAVFSRGNFTNKESSKYGYVFIRATLTRARTLIPNNSLDVIFQVGVKEKASNKTLILPNYWDIQIQEFENQKWARAILTGGRHALINIHGQLRFSYPIKLTGKTYAKTSTYIGPFENGLARVNLGGSYVEGYDIVDPRHTMVGHKLQIKEGYWGYLNGNGDLSIPATYQYASDFANGKAIVKTAGKYGVIDTLGQLVIEPVYDSIAWLTGSNHKFFQLFRNESEHGAINAKGKVVLKAVYEKVGDESEGLISIKKNGLWGFADTLGNIVIEPAYQGAMDFSGNLAAIKKGNLWGYINKGGSIVIEPQFRKAGSFGNELAPVVFKSGWKYINTQGKIIINKKIKRAEDFKDGLAKVKVKKKWKLIDTDGKFIHSQGFSKINDFAPNGLAIVKKGKKYQLLNREGKIITKSKYNYIDPFSDGLACVTKNNKQGFVDSTGKVVIPIKYNAAGNFNEGLAKVLKSGKWGYINHSGSLAIAHIYRRCESFSEGYGTGIQRGKTIVFDKNGSQLFELSASGYTGVYSDGYLHLGNTLYNRAGVNVMDNVRHSFHNGVAIIKESHKIPGSERYEIKDKMVDKNLIPLATYSHISPLKNGFAKISVDVSYGLADDSGKVLLPCNYQTMTMISPDIFKIENFGSLGYLRANGEWIWEVSE